MLFAMDQCFAHDDWLSQDEEKYPAHCDRISIAATLDAI